ncbi:MAG: outer membrane protein assembly factor BamD [Gemmatimonadota bacterium]|jgi:outer membrane protein assembly factor BamD
MTPRTRAFIGLMSLGLAACGGSSQYQGLDAEELYRTARMEYDEGSYDNTIEALERLMVAFPTYDSLPSARFLLAESYFAKEEYITARSEYQRFLDRYVGHPLSPAAALGMCRSLSELSPIPQRDQTFTREAVTICGNVIVDYAGTPEALEAAEVRQSLRETLAEKEYLNARHYFRRKQYDPAIKYFEFVVDDYPESDYAPQALLGLYRSNEEIGYDDLAEEARTRLLREYPDSEAADEVRAEETES